MNSKRRYSNWYPSGTAIYPKTTKGARDTDIGNVDPDEELKALKAKVEKMELNVGNGDPNINLLNGGKGHESYGKGMETPSRQKRLGRKRRT